MKIIYNLLELTNISEIYYLLEFHEKCQQITGYGNKIRNNFCSFVNVQLNDKFTTEQQKQLKMHNFSCDCLDIFAFSIVYGISFDNIDKKKLADFFDIVCGIDLDELDKLNYLNNT